MIQAHRIYQGDCIEVMKTWPENFVDTIVTDPPYGLSFMGKDWDHGIPGEHFWAEMLRICKPGATLLAFGGTRTYHRLAVAIEDAGWEIRDCLMWLYGSGFPKSHNLHGAFEGWGTALKPAWEPIILAMKPIEGTFAENGEKWGVAGINVDGSRIATDEIRVQGRQAALGATSFGGVREGGRVYDQGRWPANLILDEEAAEMLDGQSGGLGKSSGGGMKDFSKSSLFQGGTAKNRTDSCGLGDSGGASRFFYVAKSAKAERNEGCEGLEEKVTRRHGDRAQGSLPQQTPQSSKPEANHHPTVKPLSLMKYLCNLTKTPTGGIVLDPFAGSGTTLWAAEYHNRPWIGIEMNPEYVAIAEARIARERAQMKMAI